MLIFIFSVYIFYCNALTSLASFLYIPPATVPEVKVSAYLGRWFQMYASLVPNTTFEKNAYCVTADYFPSTCAGAAFDVVNGESMYQPDGNVYSVTGTAFPTKSPGKFKVKFVDQPTIGDYWITALGPLNDTDPDALYPWAIVSTPFLTSLFILARDVTTFRTMYQDHVLVIAYNEGFYMSWNKPLETYQGADCAYIPIPSVKELITVQQAMPSHLLRGREV